MKMISKVYTIKKIKSASHGVFLLLIKFSRKMTFEYHSIGDSN